MAPTKAKTRVVGKKDVIDAIARKSKLSKKDAQAALKGLMDAVKENLKKGVTVRRFLSAISKYAIAWAAPAAIFALGPRFRSSPGRFLHSVR